MFGGKNKAITFSYDDGVEQDRWLVDVMNTYGLRGTFNINSGRFGQRGQIGCHGAVVPHCMMTAEEVAHIYIGHEVAGHSLTHPTLTDLPDEEVLRQVEVDRQRLETVTGRPVVGFAYPNGGRDRRVMEVMATGTGIQYARTVEATGGFALPEDPLAFHPTVYHLDWEKMLSLAETFLAAEAEEPMLFTIWGHSYELDCHPDWKPRFAKFCKRISGRPDVAYLTNGQALQSLLSRP